MAIYGALTRTGGTLLAQGGAGAWDEGKIGPLTVLKFSSTDYRCWFEGNDAGFTVCGIGYATSSDGSTWSKSGSNPIFSATQSWENSEVSVGTVIWDNEANIFKMWYHGGFNSLPRKIGLAYSSDGLTWTRQNSNNPVLSPGAAATWDESSVADAAVVRVSSTDYRMWYLGKNASNVQKIGYATSTDGISWSKSGSNPVFASGTAGQWDDGTIYGLKVLYRPGDPNLHAWYSADDGTLADATATGLGYASSTDGVTWTRGPNNPVLVGTTSPEQWLSDPVFAYQDVDTVRVVFYYDNFTSGLREHREATITAPAPGTGKPVRVIQSTARW